MGVFVTAFYSFRMYFLVFHGQERFHHKPHPGEHDGHPEDETHAPRESAWVVTAPLVLLAIPSVLIGYMTIEPMLFGEFLKDAIAVDTARHPAMAALAAQYHGALAMSLHGLQTLPFWLAFAGVGLAWWLYLKRPDIPRTIGQSLAPVVRVLENKYYIDAFNERVLAAGARLVGKGLWKGGDAAVIDGVLVDGSARAVGALARWMRLLQAGRLYGYALVMLLGVFGFMTWRLWPHLSGLFGH